MKATMMCNAVIKAVLALCVTFAAIHFSKVGILWWYLLLPWVGYEYNETPLTNRRANDEQR